MLRAERPDGVVICVGPAAHAALAVELLGQGAHVYTEKPTAPTLAEGLAMLRESERAGRICMTAYKKRYAPAYLEAKRHIDGEAFGARLALDIVRSCGGGPTAPERMRAHLLDWTCHTLDLAAFLWGPARRVATTRAERGGRYAWSVTIEHVDGALSTQLFSDGPASPIERVYACGSGGLVVRVDNSTEMVATRQGRPIDGYQPSWTTGGAFSDEEQGFSGQLLEFVDAIRQARAPRSDIRQACHALALFEAMWASRDGKPSEVEFLP
jgi:predicted dehydrogenase